MWLEEREEKKIEGREKNYLGRGKRIFIQPICLFLCLKNIYGKLNNSSILTYVIHNLIRPDLAMEFSKLSMSYIY